MILTFDQPHDPGKPPLSFHVFSGQRAFLEHCDKHFLSASEPWDQVLPRAVIKGMRKKRAAAGVVEWNAEWQAFYEAVCGALRQGIGKCLQRPVYIVARQTLNPNERGSYRRTTFAFLSDEGYLVFADGTTVRTAYFRTPTGQQKDLSKFTRYREAWRHLRDKFHRVEYVDDDGGRTVRNDEVSRMSNANWTTCPNPHAMPPRPARRVEED